MVIVLRHYFRDFFLLQSTPSLVVLPVWVLGIIFSIRTRQQNPQKFTATVSAFIILLAESIANIFVRALLFVNESMAITSNDDAAGYLEMVDWGSILIRVIAWIILLNVLFGQKSLAAAKE